MPGLEIAYSSFSTRSGALDLTIHHVNKGINLCPEVPALNKKLSGCECIIEYKAISSAIPYHQLVLGGIQSLPQKYPYLDIKSIDPSIVNLK
jgi:hypothetical protein